MHRIDVCQRHLRECVLSLRRAGTRALQHRASQAHRAAIRAASACTESGLAECTAALRRAESEPPLLYCSVMLRTSRLRPTAATM